MLLRIPRLKYLVAKRHRCRADHTGSRVVVERLPDGGVWRGTVEVFELTGHPETDRCYAWVEKSAGEYRWVTRLKVPPVKSAQTAVRATLARRKRTRAGSAAAGEVGQQHDHNGEP